MSQSKYEVWDYTVNQYYEWMIIKQVKKAFTYCMFWYWDALTHAKIDQSIRPIHLQAARDKENEKQWWVYTPSGVMTGSYQSRFPKLGT